MKPLHYIQLDNATPLHPMALWDGAVAQSVTHNTDSHFCILWNTHATFVTEKKNIPPSQKVIKISETGLINRKRATSLEKAIFSCLLPCQNIASQIKHRSVIGENAQFIRAYIIPNLYARYCSYTSCFSFPAQWSSEDGEVWIFAPKRDVLGPQSFLGAGEPIVMGVTPLTNDNAKTSVGEDLM